MLRLTNTVKDYPWGAPSGIPEILGLEPDGTPAAELWVGAHPAAPSRADGRGLDDLIAEDPVRSLGPDSLERFGPRLPYLLKVLSARTALSIQCHPTREQARAGFAAEEAVGLPRNAADRTYRDAWHKPELILALGEFHALCGFRPVPAILATLERFAGALDRAGADPAQNRALADWRDALASAADEEAALRAAVSRVLGERERFGALAAALTAALSEELTAGSDAPASGPVDADDPAHEGSVVDPALTLVETAADFPHDAGSLVAVMLRRHRLRAGESLLVESGVLHAYLRGLGIEIMASSDNVLRGGLTGKHIDVPELLRIGRFDASAPRVRAVGDGEGVQGATDDFVLTAISEARDRTLTRAGALTVLCTAGSYTLASGDDTADLRSGEALFVGADEPRPRVTGSGALFVASTGLSA